MPIIGLPFSSEVGSGGRYKSEENNYGYTNIEGERVTPTKLLICSMLSLAGMCVMLIGLTRGLRFGWLLVIIGSVGGVFAGTFLLPL